jgi:hypothetical protein
VFVEGRRGAWLRSGSGVLRSRIVEVGEVKVHVQRVAAGARMWGGRTAVEAI